MGFEMAIRENIIKVREVFDLTQDELAKIAGVTRGAVSQWEGGFSEPRMGAIQKMADYFGITKSNIIEDGGMDLIDPITKKQRSLPKCAIFPKPSPRATAPLLGRVHAGSAQEPEILEDEIELPYSVRQSHPNAYFLQVEGDCMDRVYPEGCYILVDPDQEPHNGSIAAVSIDGTEYVMRRLLRTTSTMVLAPESFNDQHQDIVITAADDRTVELVGTVVWFQSSKEME